MTTEELVERLLMENTGSLPMTFFAERMRGATDEIN